MSFWSPDLRVADDRILLSPFSFLLFNLGATIVLMSVSSLKKNPPALLLFFVVFTSFAPAVRAAQGELYFIHTDHLGSTTVVTDEGGNVVQQERSYPYGKTRQSNLHTSLKIAPGTPTERVYTSQIKDKATKLHYYNARYYDPVLGTFSSADEQPDSVNRYAYVHGNPLRGIDPTGNQTDVTNPGSGDSHLPGISSSSAYVNTVVSTTVENAYQSDYEPTVTDRAVLYGVAGAGAAISGAAGGAFVYSATGIAAIAGMSYGSAYAPGVISTVGTAAKILGGAGAAYEFYQCMSGDQDACSNLVAGAQVTQSYVGSQRSVDSTQQLSSLQRKKLLQEIGNDVASSYRYTDLSPQEYSAAFDDFMATNTDQHIVALQKFSSKHGLNCRHFTEVTLAELEAHGVSGANPVSLVSQRRFFTGQGPRGHSIVGLEDVGFLEPQTGGVFGSVDELIDYYAPRFGWDPADMAVWNPGS